MRVNRSRWTARPRRPSARARPVAEAVEGRTLFAALSVSDVAIVEGTGGATPTKANFTVTLHQPGSAGQTVTANFATADGSATAGSDYVARTGSVTFAPGVTTQNIVIDLVNDGNQEGAETFALNLSNPANAMIADGSGKATIADDDRSFISVSDAAVAEGDGPVNLVFTVTRSGALGGTSTVNYAAASGSATLNTDFTLPGGAVTFNPGEATKTITATITGDGLQENTEFFNLTLSNVVNSTLVVSSAQGYVLDDDAAAFAIADTHVTEGNAGGTVNATFTVTRLGSTNGAASVAWAVFNGTATAPDDFAANAGGVLNFAAGDTSETFTVAISGDALPEDVETLVATLSNPQNGTIVRGAANAFILNDDPAPTPYLYVSDAAVVEGDNGTTLATFTVTRAGPTAGTSAVQYRTVDGSALAGLDYTAIAPTPLTFNPGETTKTVQVQVTGDTRKELPEAFTLALQSPSGAALADAAGEASVVDDDGASGLFINDVAVVEGDTGSVDAVFTVTRLGETNGEASFRYSTSNGSANSSDYVAFANELVEFAPGEVTKTVTVPVNGDGSVEGGVIVHETFFVALFNAGNADAVGDGGQGFILDNDASVITVGDVTLVEGTGGTTNAVFTVRRLGSTAWSASFSYATANGTAVAPGDYTAAQATTLTFAAGQTSRTVSIPVQGDTAREAAEAFTLTLSSPSNTTLAANGASTLSATGTILDDDQAPRVTNVYVRGTDWSQNFRSYIASKGLGLQSYGFAVPAGAGQLDELPWANVDRVSVRFNQAVVVEQEDLTVRGVNVPEYAVNGFTYDTSNFTATWTLAAPVRNDKLLLDLSGAAGGVTSITGDPLDGEWADGADAFPSGNDTPGGDFRFRLHVLPGDASRSGAVNIFDFVETQRKLFRATNTPGTGPAAYSPFHDLDGSGMTTSADLAIARRNLGHTLPAANPTAAVNAFSVRRVSLWQALERE